MTSDQVHRAVVCLANVKVKGVDDLFVTTDINTLLAAPYVKTDDWLGKPRRPGCGRSRPTVKRSDLAGWAHLRLLLVARTVSGACACI
jgi:hypothetical protein